MRRLLVLLVIAGAMLAMPSVSQARSEAYWWTPYAAAQALVNGGIQWNDGYDGIDYARCNGYGYYLRRGGYVYYTTFVCYVEPDNDYPYYVRLFVVGRYSYNVRFMRYA